MTSRLHFARAPEGALRLLALLFTLLASCATARLGEGTAHWHRIQTEHFMLYSDLPEADALEKARDFERWLSAFQQHGFRVTGQLPMRLNVVVFRHDLDFRRHAGDNVDGYHVSSILFEPWIVMPAHHNERALTVFRHELTHYIASLAMPHQPAWFAEGLASYFESAQFSGPLFNIGAIPTEHANWLVAKGPLRVQDVFAPDADRHASRFYATSWLIVHYLMSEQSRAFEDYQIALARGEGHERAWASAFPQLSPAQLDVLVRNYLHGQAFARYQLPVSAQPGRASATLLSRADEHALQGLLWASRCDGCTDARRAALIDASMGAALLEDRFQPQAFAWQLLQRPHASHADVEQAAELTRRHPDTWLAWLTLGLVAMQADELLRVRDELDPVAALERLVPASPYPHLLAAFQYQREDKRTEALREAGRARRKSPSNPVLLALQTDLLASLAACAELDDTLRLLDEIGHTAGSALSTREQTELRQRCATQASVSPASVHAP